MYWEILKFRDSKSCKEWPLGKREWANEQNASQFPCACLSGSSIYRCKSLLGKSSGTGISNRSRQLYPRFIPCKSPKEFVEGTTGHYVEAWPAVFKWLVQPRVHWESHNLVLNLNQRASTASVGSSFVVIFCVQYPRLLSCVGEVIPFEVEWLPHLHSNEGKFSNFEGGIRLLVQQALQALPERLG